VHIVDDKRFEQITVTVEGGVATVTLDRPERYNALGSLIVGELVEVLEDIEGSEETRVMILTGTGEKAFCSGVDLKERAEMDDDERWAHNRALNAFAERLARLQAPTIAAINGLAFGGGLILTGRRITADDALEMGLVSKVSPAGSLMDEARVLAEEIAANSPLAVAYAKAAVDLASEAAIEQGLRFETAAIRATLSSEDYEIGLAAFAEKRDPSFPPLTARRVT
jgi:enoyl-CoA hydratase/carnithine racemase